MTLQQIRYFISVAESGSISEAAKRLFTAQSSISSAIKEIENTYDITAFIRESTGVRLTRSGEELLIEFKGILSRLDYLDEKFNGSPPLLILIKIFKALSKSCSFSRK